MMRHVLRLAPIVAAVVAIAGCDARRLTSNDTGDSFPPSIDVTVPGDTTQPVDIGQPLAVTVTAGDNLSLLRIELTVTAGARLIQRDTVRFSSQTPTYRNTFSVSLTGVGAGSPIVIRGVALDGAGNIGIDSMVLVAADTSNPTVQILSPVSGTEFKTGNLMRIALRASDNAGLDRLGYEIAQIGTAGDTTLFFRDSTIFPAGNKPTSKDTTFTFTIPAGMPASTFGVRGFANDVSGNRGFSPYAIIVVRDTVGPSITILAPPESARFNPADSILVTTRITDAVGLARMSLVGIATRGDPVFGVVDTVIRFDSVFAPVNIAGNPQSFPPGVRDTTILRFLRPVNPADTITEPIRIVGRVTDISGNTAQTIRTIILVSGPRITVVRPGPGSVTAPGQIIIVELRATDVDGVNRLGYTVPELGVTRSRTFTTNPTDTVMVDTLLVPSTVAPGSRLTISPFAFDRGGQPGSATPVSVLVQAPPADTQGPFVHQSVGDKFEVDDTLRVRALDANGIASIGYFIKDSAGVTRDSALRTLSGLSGDETALFQVNVPTSLQGARIQLTSFAFDTRGNVGYSTSLTDTVPAGTPGAALVDTIDVVYGRTFPLPTGGVGADIAVDTVTGRQRAFISNITFSRLEVWERATQAFNARKIAVGSQPWGMFIDSDTLLVANSGGTNISRVMISSAALSGVNENLGIRIKTPLSIQYDVDVTIDESGFRRFKVEAFQFSDRPQYLAQMQRTAGNKGDIFYSTKPTTEAPEGTIRRYDVAAKESQQVWQYASKNVAPRGNIGVFNSDSLFVVISTDSTRPDIIYICDHPYGDQNPASAYCLGGTDIFTIIYGDGSGNPFLRDAVRRSDVVGVSEINMETLALTDTTFVAAGGDRRWIAFGEGNTTGRAGRVMMAKDTNVVDVVTGATENYFSPSVYVRDLTNNASDVVYGIALNRNSSLLGVHGIESYFSEVNHPLLLRLQGKVNTFDVGAGITFHPDNANDPATDGAAENTAFVASSNGTIEIVDTHHFTSRGTLPVRANLYGPIRVTKPFAGDDPTVVLKIFGLTTEGFIVIDIRAEDIKPLP